jgi:hypothetical protein
MATDTAGMMFSYHEIHLSQLDWQSVNPLLLVMAPFLRGFTQDQLEAAADEIIANAPPEYVRLLVGGLLIVTRRKFKRFKNFAAIEQAILQKVKATMNFLAQIILEDPEIAQLVAQKTAEAVAKAATESKAEGKAEGEAKGKAEGEAKGKAEGEAKGKAEGEAKGKAEGEAGGLRLAVTLLWQSRYGAVPLDVSAALAPMDAMALQSLFILITTATEADARLALGL